MGEKIILDLKFKKEKSQNLDYKQDKIITFSVKRFEKTAGSALLTMIYSLNAYVGSDYIQASAQNLVLN